MTNNDMNKKILYFNRQIQNAFSILPNYPCTLVEAPMGYGKTTAVKEFLTNLDAVVIWQSIYGKSEVEFWNGFCQGIAKIDENCAKHLQNIGMPKESLMKREVMLSLEELQIPTNTYFVIDDYHFVKSAEVSAFLELFIRNIPQRLHIIVISRTSVFKNNGELQLKGIVHYIGTKMLEFSPEDIEAYYFQCGIKISDEEKMQIYSRTEGWVSALYLLLREHELCGSFILTKSMSEMIYYAVYEPLEDELKAFLKTMCLFDKFSLEQAEYMWNEKAGDHLRTLIENHAFITLEPDFVNYTFHSIFSACIQEQFQKLPEKTKKEIWNKIGTLHLRSNAYLSAMKCFSQGEAYDSFLIALEQDRGDSIFLEQKEFILKGYSNCPMEIKKKHPIAILVYAVIVFVNYNEYTLFEAACGEFLWCVENNPSLSIKEQEQLMGEYELLQGISAFNDLMEMGKHFKKAVALLTAPPQSISANNSWTFGSPSVLCLYHREAGSLKERVEFYQSSKNYTANTGGHGSGSRNLFEAEWNYYIGEFENAEILVYQAISEAKTGQQQLDIVLCANFLLARLALIKSDFTHATALMEEMRNEIKKDQIYTLIYTIELCDTYIYACLGQNYQKSDWLMEEEYLQNNIFFPSLAFFNIVLGKVLLNMGKVTKLLGLSDGFLRQASFYPNLLASIYTEIYVAMANWRLSRMEEGVNALKRAIGMAMPDALIMPFVENADELTSLFEKILQEELYADFMKKIMEIRKQYSTAIKRINAEHFANHGPKLTPREKEIALLVMKGLNNKEIGLALYISPNTVKRDLKNIFTKLGITSRALLMKEMLL
ncbi:HTH-type transcriptional regulator MalT [Anaerotignum neopropionicum]|uniref:HTH-type transcriptional regulator MalT n=1 Tax=Anaerotignum neopropionicum TaxID=36847 RepID=A0A136WCD4_9FIRM|nr:LuxR C-terminal-related transcriptional regulator [Anaerotignum neopropionicum]KXL52173.1 HTH-type transcriptional regulator MalT [Anaerotignum neopropionicum]